jgi:hypothetical protein
MSRKSLIMTVLGVGRSRRRGQSAKRKVPRGHSRGRDGAFTRRSEAVAVVGVGLERLEGLDGLASRDAGGGIDGGPRWKVPAVGEAAEAFVSRCAMGAKHGVRRRSRLARSTREAQGSQLARAPQLGRRL